MAVFNAGLFTLILSFNLVYGGNLSETELHARLFEHYNPDVIPKKDKDAPMVIGMELHLMSIEDVDERKQTFSARCFLEITWRDEFLVWDPDDYGGVTAINVQNENIWKPDLSLRGTFGKPGDLGQEGGRAIIDSNGSVIIWPYKLFTVGCRIYITNFPFDSQLCELVFLSWTSTSSVIKLMKTSDQINFSQYAESGEWELVESSVNFYTSDYGNDTWDNMAFRIQLKRKWLFYVLNLLAPVVVISLLNVICFALPAVSGERVTLCISIFLTLAVFLTIITSSMPESSDDVAAVGIYIGLQLLGSALTILMSVVSLCFFHKDPSACVPVLLRLLAKMCCVVPKVRNKHEEDIGVDRNLLTNGRAALVPVRQTRYQNVTWKIISHATDRLCLVLAIVWHIALLIGFMGSVTA